MAGFYPVNQSHLKSFLKAQIGWKKAGLCFHKDFDVSACAQKISGFGMLNNVKVKKEASRAQQKC